jgi:hypothetical protein
VPQGWSLPHFDSIDMKAKLSEVALLAPLAIGLVGCAGVTPDTSAIQRPNWVKVGKIREIDLSSLQRSGDFVTYRSRDAVVFFANYKVSAICSTFERQELENTQVKDADGQMRTTYPDTEHRKEVETACRLASR